MSNNYGPRIVTDGLVLCLDAADQNSYSGSGNTWTDLSGNGNNGTLTNGPTFSSTNAGALVFDGSNDYIILDNVYEIGTSNFSISCWVKSSYTGNWQYILSNKEDFNGPFVRCGFETGTGKLRLYLEADTQANTVIVSDSSYTDGNWHNVVFIRNGSNGIMYVDGYLKKTATTQSGNVGNSTSSWFIANDGNNNGHLQGLISNLCFYGRVLSAAEILKNFEATKGRFGL